MKYLLPLLLSSYYHVVVAQNSNTYETTIPQSTVKFKMVAIPNGNFLIGSTSTAPGHEQDEGPQKKIQISAFWMGTDTFVKSQSLLS